jgi:crossover junction endodeoxyribonuclease RuvC
MNKATTIFGIDPGFDRLGWAVGKVAGGKLQLLSYGLIETDRSGDIFSRLQQVERELDQLVAEFLPTEVAFESLFVTNNHKTVINVAQARGVALGSFLRVGAKCFEYTPSQIKLAAAGDGRADKKAVEKMMRLQFNLPPEKIVDDTIDALAVLCTHAAVRKV